MSTHANGLSILHVFSGDLWAGAEVMIFNLLNNLRHAPNLSVTALSLNEGILTHKLRQAGVETWVIPEARNSLPTILWKAARLFRHRSFDLIHSHRYKENLLALLLGKRLGAKRLVSTLHGLSETHVARDRLARSSPKARLDYAVLRRYFTRIVAVSQDMRRTLMTAHRFSPDTIDLIYNGVPVPETPARTPPSAQEQIRIGTVGRLVPVKDFHLFLRVAAEVRRRTDSVRFSILGDGPLRADLSRTARELRLEGCVEFLPPRPDPASYYSSLDIYLNSSHHEGLPLSVLEAMARARPIVAPRTGGIPEIISHGEEGFLVGSRHPADFAEPCITLIRDQELRRTLGRNAARRVRSSYTDSRMAECYAHLYSACCDPAPAASGRLAIVQ